MSGSTVAARASGRMEISDPHGGIMTLSGGSSCMAATETKMLTTGKCAKVLGFSTKAVQLWCDQGLLECKRMPSGHRRISVAALKKFARLNGYHCDLSPRQ